MIVGPQIVASTTDAGDIKKHETVNSAPGLAPLQAANFPFSISSLSTQAPEAVSTAPIVRTLSTSPASTSTTTHATSIIADITTVTTITNTSSKTERHEQPSEARALSGAPASEASATPSETSDTFRALIKEALAKHPRSRLRPMVKRRRPSSAKHRVQPPWGGPDGISPAERVLNFHHIMAAAETAGDFHVTINLNLSYKVEQRVVAADDPTGYAYRLIALNLGDIPHHIYIFVEDGPVESATEIRKRAALGLNPNCKRHIHGEMSFAASDLSRVIAALCAAGGGKRLNGKGDDVPHQLKMARRPNGGWRMYAGKAGHRYAVSSQLRKLAEARYTEERDHENKRRRDKQRVDKAKRRSLRA